MKSLNTQGLPIKRTNTGLFEAVKNGDKAALADKLRPYYINTTDEDGCTLLYRAAEIGNKELVELLFQKNSEFKVQKPIDLNTQTIHTMEMSGGIFYTPINIDKYNKDVISPLHIATKNGHVEIVRTLIKKGANLNVTDENGNTPLYLAIKNNLTDIAEILSGAGADTANLSNGMLLDSSENNKKLDNSNTSKPLENDRNLPNRRASLISIYDNVSKKSFIEACLSRVSRALSM